jgi:hypothetical protein
VRERSAYISYTTDDAAAVARLKRDLAAANIPVPVDANALDDELRWQPAVKQAIRTCGLFLACFSDRSVATPQTKTELKLALEQQPRGEAWLIVVKFGPCELPPALEGLETVDLYEQWEQGIERLVALAPKSAAPVIPQKQREKPGTIHVKGHVIAGGEISMDGEQIDIEGNIVGD